MQSACDIFQTRQRQGENKVKPHQPAEAGTDYQQTLLRCPASIRRARQRQFADPPHRSPENPNGRVGVTRLIYGSDFRFTNNYGGLAFGPAGE